MTEQLLPQQLESPSGTGRVEPLVHTSLTPDPTHEWDTNSHSHWRVGVPSKRRSGISAGMLAFAADETDDRARACAWPLTRSR